MVKKVKMDEIERNGNLHAQGGRIETAPGERMESAAGDGKNADGPSKEEELMIKLQEAEKKAAENYDKYVRAAAELDNYKKRAVREKADAIKYGTENLLRDILPLMDNMDRAIDHACNSDDFDAFKQGLKMLQEQLSCCLQKHGVEQIDTMGKAFDPNLHEAMMQVESNDHKPSTVVGEFERGYLLNGRLLRPAKVSVCRRSNGEDRQDCEQSKNDGNNI